MKLPGSGWPDGFKIVSKRSSLPSFLIARRQFFKIFSASSSFQSWMMPFRTYASAPSGTDFKKSPPTASHRAASSPFIKAAAVETTPGKSKRTPRTFGFAERVPRSNAPWPPPTSTISSKLEKSYADCVEKLRNRNGQKLREIGRNHQLRLKIRCLEIILFGGFHCFQSRLHRDSNVCGCGI